MIKEKENALQFQKYSCLLFVIFLVATIALNSVLRHSFYNQSLNFIISLQAYNNIYLDIIMNIFSLLANTNFILGLLILLYSVFERKLAVLVYVSYFLANTYLINILKMSYQQPRPFWTANEIQTLEWGCPAKYGNPSGHSWMVILIYEPLVTDFLRLGKNESRKRLFWYILPVLIGIFIPFSRMYLGSHTGNEIVMGLTLGLIMNALYRFKVYELIYNFYLSTYHKLSLYTSIQLVIVNIFMITVPCLLYSINSVNPSISIYPHLINLNTKCHTNEHTALSIEQASLRAHALVNLVFGFIFGLDSSDKISWSYYLGKWKYNLNPQSGLVSKFILKLLAEAAVSCPFAITFTLVMPLFIQNAYLKYLSSCLGYWMCGFMLVKYGDVLLRKYNIITCSQKNSLARVDVRKKSISEEVGNNQI